MGQLPAISREQLTAEDQAIWDRVMNGRSGGAGRTGR